MTRRPLESMLLLDFPSSRATDAAPLLPLFWGRMGIMWHFVRHSPTFPHHLLLSISETTFDCKDFFSTPSLQKWQNLCKNRPKRAIRNIRSMSLLLVYVKLKAPGNTRFCAVRGLSQTFPQYTVSSKKVSEILPSFFTKFQGLWLPSCAERGHSPSCGTSRPSSFSLCSCILAAEALRNWTRDCLTSSSAAWTASSVRARASSAYSLATW